MQLQQWPTTIPWADRIFGVHPLSMLRAVSRLTIPASQEWGHYLGENKTIQNPNNLPLNETGQLNSSKNIRLILSNWKKIPELLLSPEAKVLALLCWLCCCWSSCEAGWALPCTGGPHCPRLFWNGKPQFCIHCPDPGSFPQDTAQLP